MWSISSTVLCLLCLFGVAASMDDINREFVFMHDLWCDHAGLAPPFGANCQKWLALNKGAQLSFDSILGNKKEYRVLSLCLLTSMQLHIAYTFIVIVQHRYSSHSSQAMVQSVVV